MTDTNPYGVASEQDAEGRYTLIRPPLQAVLRQQITELSVHIPCGRLRGPVGGPGGRWQSCQCEQSPEVWPGSDVPREIDLCIVCARGAAGGTSRWAPIGCTHCRAVNISLGTDLGYRPLALGRHSLINGIGVRGGSPPVEQEHQTARLMQFQGHHRALWAWYREEFARLAAVFDPQADVPLRSWQQQWPPSRDASEDAIRRMRHRDR